MSCNDANEFYDECNRKCMCYEGELLFCHRIRNEFTAMNFETEVSTSFKNGRNKPCLQR